MKEHYSVVIVGGGQAGLSLSYCLKEQGLDHIIFEKHTIAHAWRHQRWDSFCLVTPNWQCRLPGFTYSGPDPNGFMLRDQIVEFIEAYAVHFQPPIKTGVEVLRVHQLDPTTFEIKTSIGTCTANQVAIATGGYHQPKIPSFADQIPTTIAQYHSSQYKNPQLLPEGEVLVIGTGQSGCQIAEDLHLAGRQVHLCVGQAPKSPRVYRGLDVVEWLERMGYYDLPIDQHPQKESIRERTNHYVTGRNGGHEIDLRQFAVEGMKLYGRLQSIQQAQLVFEDNLQQNLDRADEVAESIKRSIDQFIADHHIEAPTDPPYQPVWQPDTFVPTLLLNDSQICSVIWCTGYRMNYQWIDMPVLDHQGYPQHQRGITPIPGLYFLGLPWLHTWGSGRFSGIAKDAQFLAHHMAANQNTFQIKLSVEAIQGERCG